MTKHSENKTIDWKNRFREKYVENDDPELVVRLNTTEEVAELEDFIQSELDLALKQRTEEIEEKIKNYILPTGFGSASGGVVKDEILKIIKSKYLKQEESSKRG